MNPLYPFTALETVKTFQPLPESCANEDDVAYRCFPKWEEALANLPPPPDKIESLADLAQAILQPAPKRISLANAENACNKMIFAYVN